MLTKLCIRNFKLFKDVEIKLDGRVVLVGPNNSGKTSVLQAIELWSLGVRRLEEREASGDLRSSVLISPRRLTS